MRFPMSMGSGLARNSIHLVLLVLLATVMFLQSHASALELVTIWNKELHIYPTTPPPSYQLAMDEDGAVIPGGYDLTAYGRSIDGPERELTFLETNVTTLDFDIACRPSLEAYWLGSCAGLIAIVEDRRGTPPNDEMIPFDQGGFHDFFSVFTYQYTYREPFGHGMQTGHGYSGTDNELRAGYAQWIRLKRQGTIITAFIGDWS